LVCEAGSESAAEPLMTCALVPDADLLHRREQPRPYARRVQPQPELGVAEEVRAKRQVLDAACERCAD